MPGKSFRQYREAEMNSALEAIKKGSTVRNASKKFEVPYTTLLYKSQGKFGNKMGPEPILKAEYEETLIGWINKMKELGFPIVKDHLLDSVERLVTLNKIETKFKKNRPGKSITYLKKLQALTADL